MTTVCGSSFNLPALLFERGKNRLLQIRGNQRLPPSAQGRSARDMTVSGSVHQLVNCL